MVIEKLTEIPKDWVGDPSEFEPGWWLKDKRLPDVLYIGPYDTKAEAEDIKRGQARYWKWEKADA